MDMAFVSRTLVLSALLVGSAAVSAATVNGALGVYGTSTEFAGPPAGVNNFATVTADAGLTTVISGDADLAFLEDLDIAINSFDVVNSVGATLLSSNVNGFSFVINSVQKNDVANPAYWDFSGTGTLYLNGFDPTAATWHYADTNSSSYTLSLTATPVPLPAAGPLAALALASLFGFKRRKA
jgi:hypothetical protein